MWSRRMCLWLLCIGLRSSFLSFQVLMMMMLVRRMIAMIAWVMVQISRCSSMSAAIRFRDYISYLFWELWGLDTVFEILLYSFGHLRAHAFWYFYEILTSISILWLPARVSSLLEKKAFLKMFLEVYIPLLNKWFEKTN